MAIANRRSDSFISNGRKSVNQNTSGLASKQVLPSPDKKEIIIKKVYNDGEEVIIRQTAGTNEKVDDNNSSGRASPLLR